MEEHHASTHVGRGGRRNRCNHTLGAGGPIGSPGREYGQDPLGGLKRCVSAPGAANMPEVLHGRLHSAWAGGRVQVLRKNGVCTSAALSGSSEDRRKNANASFHSHGRHELSHWLLDGDFARQRGTGRYGRNVSARHRSVWSGTSAPGALRPELLRQMRRDEVDR